MNWCTLAVIWLSLHRRVSTDWIGNRFWWWVCCISCSLFLCTVWCVGYCYRCWYRDGRKGGFRYRMGRLGWACLSGTCCFLWLFTLVGIEGWILFGLWLLFPIWLCWGARTCSHLIILSLMILFFLTPLFSSENSRYMRLISCWINLTNLF